MLNELTERSCLSHNYDRDVRFDEASRGLISVGADNQIL